MRPGTKSSKSCGLGKGHAPLVTSSATLLDAPRRRAQKVEKKKRVFSLFSDVAEMESFARVGAPMIVFCVVGAWGLARLNQGRYDSKQRQ